MATKQEGKSKQDAKGKANQHQEPEAKHENKAKQEAAVKEKQKEKHEEEAKDKSAKVEKSDKAHHEAKDQSHGKNGNAKAEKAAKDDHAETELDEGQELNGLLKIFEEHDLTEIEPEVATELIEEWYDILNQSDEEPLKEMASSLKQLKKVLSGKKSQPEAIAEVLEQLGGQTEEYANEAKRGFKGKMHQLSELLTDAADSIGEADEDEE